MTCDATLLLAKSRAQRPHSPFLFSLYLYAFLACSLVYHLTVDAKPSPQPWVGADFPGHGLQWSQSLHSNFI